MSGIVTGSGPGVPVGWRRRICKRGNSDHVDVYFYAPNGVLVRSKKQLKDWLEKNPDGPRFEEFDWTGQHGLPNSPERDLLLSCLGKKPRGRAKNNSEDGAEKGEGDARKSIGGGMKQQRKKKIARKDGDGENGVQVGVPRDLTLEPDGELGKEAEETEKEEEEAEETGSTSADKFKARLQSLENGREVNVVEPRQVEGGANALSSEIVISGDAVIPLDQDEPPRSGQREGPNSQGASGDLGGIDGELTAVQEIDVEGELAIQGMQSRNRESDVGMRGGSGQQTPPLKGAGTVEEETLLDTRNGNGLARNVGASSDLGLSPCMGVIKCVGSGDASELDSISPAAKAVHDGRTPAKRARPKRRKSADDRVDNKGGKRRRQGNGRGTPNKKLVSENAGDGGIEEQSAMVVMMPGAKGNSIVEFSDGEEEGFRIQDVIKLYNRSGGSTGVAAKEEHLSEVETLGGKTEKREGEEIGNLSPNTAVRCSLDINGAPTGSTQEETRTEKTLSLADEERHQQVLSALHLSSMPSEILCRDRERREVLELCKQAVQQQQATAMYICGCPGTGKSLAMQELKRTVPQWALQAAVPPPTVGMMNCMCAVEPKQIFQRILSCLLASKSHPQTSAPTVVAKNALAELTKAVTAGEGKHQDGMVILILDEIDHLMTKDQSVLYELFRLTTLSNSRCILVGIANSIDMTQRLLPHLRAFNCIPSVVTFPAYNQNQISTILNQRLKLLPFQAFHPLAIELCARKVAAAFGDMRKALDVCRLAVDIFQSEVKAAREIEVFCTNGDEEEEGMGRIKEGGAGKAGTGLAEEGNKVPNIILMKHMVKALAKSFHLPLVETLQALPQHQQMILCSAVRLFRGRRKDASLGELNKTYVEQCKNASINALTSAEFTCMCTVLADQAILNIGPGREERLRRVTLRVQEEDVRFALQGVRFFRTILNEDDSKEASLGDR